jgi:3-phosphoshikimate 1-carboxyvinyltransferase
MRSPRPVRPAAGRLDARVALPGSKSLTIRALTAAALASDRSHIYGALTADDPMAMTRALEDLGVGVQTGADPWAVDGTGGHLQPRLATVNAGESALSARLLVAIAALGMGELTVDGRGSLKRRPMVGLVDALVDWGVEVHSDGGVPVTVMGRGRLRGGPIRVDCAVTSQFATALLVVAPMAEDATDLRIDGLQGSRGYLDLTVEVMRAFGAGIEPTITGFRVEPTGYRSSDFVVEPDASAAVYPMLAAAISGGRVEIGGLQADSSQPDMAVSGVFEEMGCRLESTDTGMVLEGPDRPLSPFRGDLSGMPDGALAVAAACLFADGSSELTGLGSLRHKESDRLHALATEIDRLGASATVDGDTLAIRPGKIGPMVLHPHGDHRMAMALAPIGLVVPGMSVEDPNVVDKTWPGFWAMLDNLAG